MSKIASSYTTLSVTFIIKQALNLNISATTVMTKALFFDIDVALVDSEQT